MGLGSHIRVRKILVPGFEVRSQGLTGERLDEIGLGQRKSILSDLRRRTWLASGSHRIRPGRCRSCRHEDLVGSSYRVGLGVCVEDHGVP